MDGADRGAGFYIAGVRMNPLEHPAFSAECRIMQLHESARSHGRWARLHRKQYNMIGWDNELRYAIDARKEARRIREQGHR